MRFMFSPQRSDAALLLTVSGETISINGLTYDLSVITEGATLPASATDCPFLSGDISRDNGELTLTLILPHGANPHDAIAFPAPVSATSGTVIDTANNIYPWSLA